jgi:sulfide:quinone oxidoreductase
MARRHTAFHCRNILLPALPVVRFSDLQTLKNKAMTRFNSSRRGLLKLAAAAGAAGALGLAAQIRAARITTNARIVIIGAGAAGTALANRMAERLEGAKITLVDGRQNHYYQPGYSLIAAGLKPPGYSISETRDWLPSGATLVAEPAVAIDPVAKTVSTAGNQTLDYDFLVVAPGLVLDHDAIEGFSLDMIGKNGIGALYAGPEYAGRTWEAASKFTEEGGVGLFTRPETEMKCAGAPLKHTFLIDDIASRSGAKGKYEAHYACPQNVLFSVPIVSEKTRMLFESRNIATHYGHKLKAIDSGRKVALFETSGTSTAELPYDYIHIIPPQRAPEVIRQSGLSWADKWTDQGWVECDQKTLRHLRYPEIFALGDVAGVPKGKTAASVKWQLPVVENHLLAAIEGREGTETYDGYTSCPLITRVGRAMLIEFDYHNNLVPSFPGMIAPLEELWISWLMKEVALKATYNAMLRGKA